MKSRDHREKLLSLLASNPIGRLSPEDEAMLPKVPDDELEDAERVADQYIIDTANWYIKKIGELLRKESEQ